jgi:hypothetical protein
MDLTMRTTDGRVGLYAGRMRETYLVNIETDSDGPIWVGEAAIMPDTTCGHCGRTWNSILTPVPAGRCPFENDHIYRVRAASSVSFANTENPKPTFTVRAADMANAVTVLNSRWASKGDYYEALRTLVAFAEPTTVEGTAAFLNRIDDQAKESLDTTNTEPYRIPRDEAERIAKAPSTFPAWVLRDLAKNYIALLDEKERGA